jgi:hypothetical protein
MILVTNRKSIQMQNSQIVRQIRVQCL